MARKVYALNGSPRSEWNTATLLRHALEGAEGEGAVTQFIHLYDLDFRGCTSCFACKTAKNWASGKCFMRDGLSPVLEELAQADALLLGSPIYLGSQTGEFRSMLERLVFPFLTYAESPATVFPRTLPVGLIYTMNVPEEMMDAYGYGPFLQLTEGVLARTFGHAETLCSFDTLQFDDYGKFHAPRWDPEAKARRRREVFPEDCAKARALGAKLARWE